MNIKTATKIAVCGTIIGTLMALASPYFTEWLTKSFGDSSRAEVDLYWRTYYMIRILCFEGTIIVFLVTLYLNQKE